MSVNQGPPQGQQQPPQAGPPQGQQQPPPQGPPQPRVEDNITALRQELETENKNIDIQNQAIQQSNQDLAKAITELDESHRIMHSQVSALVNQVTVDMEGQEHLINDVSGMAKSSAEAASALRRIESGRQELKDNLSSVTAQLEKTTKTLDDEKGKVRSLSEVNQQLHNLHVQQVQKIKENVELLKQLNDGIKRLTIQAEQLKAETDPKHSVVQLYTSFPYLLKLRLAFGNFIKQQLQPNTSINVQTVQQILEKFNVLAINILNQSIDSVGSIVSVLQGVNATLGNIQQVANDQQKQNLQSEVKSDIFFQNYKSKIELVKTFWSQQSNSFYLIATWLRDFAQIQYDQDLKTKLQQYKFLLPPS
jgi:chromosome segregation ATPase